MYRPVSIRRKQTRTWNGIFPPMLLFLVGEILGQVGREVVANSERSIRNAIGKVHRTADGKFQDSGRKGIPISK